MEEIEYLEEYEDLILPTIKPSASADDQSRVVPMPEDEDSSSIDQEFFETLFDDRSDDDVVTTKRADPKLSQRASLDSLDLLVKDLVGESLQNKPSSSTPNLDLKLPKMKDSTKRSANKQSATAKSAASSVSKAMSSGNLKSKTTQLTASVKASSTPAKTKSVATVRPTVQKQQKNRLSSSNSFNSNKPSRALNATTVTTVGRKKITSNGARDKAIGRPSPTVQKSRRAEPKVFPTKKLEIEDSILDPLNIDDISDSLDSDSDTLSGSISASSCTLSELSDESFQSLSDFDDADFDDEGPENIIEISNDSSDDKKDLDHLRASTPSPTVSDGLKSDNSDDMHTSMVPQSILSRGQHSQINDNDTKSEDTKLSDMNESILSRIDLFLKSMGKDNAKSTSTKSSSGNNKAPTRETKQTSKTVDKSKDNDNLAVTSTTDVEKNDKSNLKETNKINETSTISDNKKITSKINTSTKDVKKPNVGKETSSRSSLKTTVKVEETTEVVSAEKSQIYKKNKKSVNTAKKNRSTHDDKVPADAKHKHHQHDKSSLTSLENKKKDLEVPQSDLKAKTADQNMASNAAKSTSNEHVSAGTDKQDAKKKPISAEIKTVPSPVNAAKSGQSERKFEKPSKKETDADGLKKEVTIRKVEEDTFTKQNDWSAGGRTSKNNVGKNSPNSTIMPDLKNQDTNETESVNKPKPPESNELKRKDVRTRTENPDKTKVSSEGEREESSNKTKKLVKKNHSHKVSKESANKREREQRAVTKTAEKGERTEKFENLQKTDRFEKFKASDVKSKSNVEHLKKSTASNAKETDSGSKAESQEKSENKDSNKDGKQTTEKKEKPEDRRRGIKRERSLNKDQSLDKNVLSEKKRHLDSSRILSTSDTTDAGHSEKLDVEKLKRAEVSRKGDTKSVSKKETAHENNAKETKNECVNQTKVNDRSRESAKEYRKVIDKKKGDERKSVAKSDEKIPVGKADDKTKIEGDCKKGGTPKKEDNQKKICEIATTAASKETDISSESNEVKKTKKFDNKHMSPKSNKLNEEAKESNQDIVTKSRLTITSGGSANTEKLESEQEQKADEKKLGEENIKENTKVRNSDVNPDSKASTSKDYVSNTTNNSNPSEKFTATEKMKTRTSLNSDNTQQTTVTEDSAVVTRASRKRNAESPLPSNNDANKPLRTSTAIHELRNSRHEPGNTTSSPTYLKRNLRSPACLERQAETDASSNKKIKLDMKRTLAQGSQQEGVEPTDSELETSDTAKKLRSCVKICDIVENSAVPLSTSVDEKSPNDEVHAKEDSEEINKEEINLEKNDSQSAENKEKEQMSTSSTRLINLLASAATTTQAISTDSASSPAAENTDKESICVAANALEDATNVVKKSKLERSTLKDGAIKEVIGVQPIVDNQKPLQPQRKSLRARAFAIDSDSPAEYLRERKLAKSNHATTELQSSQKVATETLATPKSLKSAGSKITTEASDKNTSNLEQKDKNESAGGNDNCETIDAISVYIEQTIEGNPKELSSAYQTADILTLHKNKNEKHIAVQELSHVANVHAEIEDPLDSSSSQGNLEKTPLKNVNHSPTKSPGVITFAEWLEQQKLEDEKKRLQQISAEPIPITVGTHVLSQESTELTTKENTSKENSIDESVNESSKTLKSSTKRSKGKFKKSMGNSKDSSDTSSSSPSKGPSRIKKKNEIEYLIESFPKEMKDNGIALLLQDKQTRMVTKRSVGTATPVPSKSLCDSPITRPPSSINTKPATRVVGTATPLPPMLLCDSPRTRTPTTINTKSVAREIQTSSVVHKQPNSPPHLSESGSTSRTKKKNQKLLDCNTIAHKIRHVRVRLNRRIVRLYLENEKRAKQLGDAVTSGATCQSTPCNSKTLKQKPKSIQKPTNCSKNASTQGSTSCTNLATSLVQISEGNIMSAIGPVKDNNNKKSAMETRFRSLYGRANIMTIPPQNRRAPLPSIPSISSSSDQSMRMLRSDLENDAHNAESLTGTNIFVNDNLGSYAIGSISAPASENISALSTQSDTDSTLDVDSFSIGMTAAGENSQQVSITVPSDVQQNSTTFQTQQDASTVSTASISLNNQCTFQSIEPKVEMDYDNLVTAERRISTDVLPSIPSVQLSDIVQTESLCSNVCPSYGLQPAQLDAMGTRLYSFLHPSKYNRTHGNVCLDYCCPNLDGPMPAIDPTRIHSQLQAPVRELPAFIVMTTKLITRADLEANKNAIPASIRQKVEKITSTAGIPTTTQSPQYQLPLNITTSQVFPATQKKNDRELTQKINALTKNLPSTTTITPKVITTSSPILNSQLPPLTPFSALSKSQPITSSTTADVSNFQRTLLRNNLRTYDTALRTYFQRIMSLSIYERQRLTDSLCNSTTLTAKDVEVASRLLEEYALLIPVPVETTTSATSSSSPVTSVLKQALEKSQGKSAKKMSARQMTKPPEIQPSPTAIYDGDQNIIGYQVASPVLTEKVATQKPTISAPNSAMKQATTKTATTTVVNTFKQPIQNTPRIFYTKTALQSSTSSSAAVSPTSAVGKRITPRSGSQATVRKLPPSNAITATTSSVASLPRLTRNPHLSVGNSADTTITSNTSGRSSTGLTMPQISKRITRKAAKVVVITKDSNGNPQLPEDESILPDDNDNAHIKHESLDED